MSFLSTALKGAIADELEKVSYGATPVGTWKRLALEYGTPVSSVRTAASKMRLDHLRGVRASSPSTVLETDRSEELWNRIRREVRLREEEGITGRGPERFVEVTWRALAAEFGVHEDVVSTRARRLRKGEKAITPPLCECDHYGPCGAPGHIELWEQGHRARSAS
jgi:hypothetical protein